MNAREIAVLAVEALKYDREAYMELLQDENYEEIIDLIAEFIAEE